MIVKYILGTLGIIVLLIVAVVLIAGGDNGSSSPQGKTQVVLTDYIDKDSSVSWTQQGEITGDDVFKAVRITVSRSERRSEILGGYDEAVERTQTVANTQSAYDNFIRAINNSGFTLERASSQKDSRGVCPLGRRFIYTLHDSGTDKLYLWSTDCGGKDKGTFGGNASLVGTLFKKQISNYPEFIEGTDL